MHTTRSVVCMCDRAERLKGGLGLPSEEQEFLYKHGRHILRRSRTAEYVSAVEKM